MTKIICWSCGARLKTGSHECPVCGADQDRETPEEHTHAETVPLKNNPRTIGKTIILVLVLSAVVFGIRSSTETSTSTAPKPKPSEAADSLKSKFEASGALAAAREALRQNPADADALLRLANMLYDTEQFEDASVEYERYLLLRPRDADARVDAAYCYYRSGDIEKAKDGIRTAIRFNPHHMQAYYNLGIICLNQGEFDEARTWLKKCTEMEPNSEIARKATLLLERIEAMK